MIEQCIARGVQFMDGTMWYHSTKEIEKAKKALVGNVQKVIAAFTFMFPNEEWLHGGDVRTNKALESMGCFGDQGWYPISAILWAFDYERPVKVMMTSTQLNTLDTIVASTGAIWFAEGCVAFFDCGCTSPHRAQFEIVGDAGAIRVEDLVGGQGRSGNFSAYEVPFVGSSYYTACDKTGKDTLVPVEPCDHAEVGRRVLKVRADWCEQRLAETHAGLPRSHVCVV
jgi:predicted dehydrogenase